MRLTLFTLIILFSLSLNAQEKIADLVTDRPDQTESSSVVPHRSLQIESGFLLENKNGDAFDEKNLAYNSTLLRYGLLENFELRLGMEYLGYKQIFPDTDEENTALGLSPLYAGFKVAITEEKGWIPEIAFLGGMVLPFTADDNFKPKHAAANMRFSVAHTLSDRFSLGYNLGVEWDGESAEPGYFYSLALGIGLLDKLGMYVESFGLISENGAEHLVDGGFTYLLFPNFQLDISGGLGLNDEAIDNYVSIGFSYRIPK